MSATLAVAHPPFIPTPSDPVGSRWWHSKISTPASAATATESAQLDSGNTGIDWASSSMNPADSSALPANFNKVRVAHALLASSAFLVFFPLGGILVRIGNYRAQIVWIHAALQGFAYVVFATAAGLGIWMARRTDRLTSYHPIIGLVLFSLLGLQPVFQILNHRLYHRFPRLIHLAHIHLWLGRILLTAGIINGGLGFQFASHRPPQWSNAPKIVYGVFATLVWVVYVAVLVVWRELGKGPRPARGSQLDGAGDGNSSPVSACSGSGAGLEMVSGIVTSSSKEKRGRGRRLDADKEEGDVPLLPASATAKQVVGNGKGGMKEKRTKNSKQQQQQKDGLSVTVSSSPASETRDKDGRRSS
ncbi:hypothetical protein ABEF95_003861 [Exophiala dermatitidis]